jgi:cobalt-zinc-cadmium efflux system outer membrane protein
MKTRLIFVIFLSFGLLVQPMAQSSEALMKLVLENNRTLKAAREALAVAVLEAGSGNTPPDPEVEFGYLFGNPADIGNRIDFEITQRMDFPTAYVHRSKLRTFLSSQAELEYVLTRQEVLLEARQLWIEHLHCNLLRHLLGERLSQARTIQSHTEKKVDAGEAGILELSQSRLMVASLEGEYEEVLALSGDLRIALKEITGGMDVEIEDTLYPLAIPIVADSLIEAYRLSPYAQYYDQELQVKEAEKNLAISRHLPKLSAGYYSESITDEAFRGFRLGLTVPLWENVNTVKKAQSEVALAEAEIDRRTFYQEREVRQMLNRLESYRTMAQKLDEALGTVNSLSLLSSSLENGEISLSEYFYTSDFYFRKQAQLLRYKKELLLQEAELMKIYL